MRQAKTQTGIVSGNRMTSPPGAIKNSAIRIYIVDVIYAIPAGFDVQVGRTVEMGGAFRHGRVPPKGVRWSMTLIYLAPDEFIPAAGLSRFGWVAFTMSNGSAAARAAHVVYRAPRLN